ncbi:hypothetical protein AHAS_Ahas13G0266900 [Arachis hypogaea]
MLKIDKATLVHLRKNFARIYVELNLCKKLISKISNPRTTLNIEYQGLHLICFNCELYGHHFDLYGEASFNDEDYCGKAAAGKNVVTKENQIMVINDKEEVNPE